MLHFSGLERSPSPGAADADVDPSLGLRPNMALQSNRVFALVVSSVVHASAVNRHVYMCMIVSNDRHRQIYFEVGLVGMFDVLIRGTPAYDCME